MESVLLVCDKKQQTALAAMFRGSGYDKLILVQNAGEARRQLADMDFGLVVINTPLSDEFGRDLALDCAGQSTAGIVLLAAGPQADKIAAGLESRGVFVQQKPVARQALLQTVRLTQVSRGRLLELQKKNRQLMAKLDDMRYICKAKCALIAYRRMTEQEAHKYIEQTAMEQRVTRRDVARDILETFEE